VPVGRPLARRVEIADRAEQLGVQPLSLLQQLQHPLRRTEHQFDVTTGV
jgi:hypothetical protein